MKTNTFYTENDLFLLFYCLLLFLRYDRKHTLFDFRTIESVLIEIFFTANRIQLDDHELSV